MITHIKNLRLRAIIGVNDWEREHKQDVIINVKVEFDGSKAAESDNIRYTVDYKKIKERIIREVKNSKFYLLEKLADHILKIVMADKKVIKATVEVDKPHALRFADSVSVICSEERVE